MQNKKSRLVILIVSFVSSLAFCGNNNVSAYSVSMTTNNAVVVDASPSGSGVSIHGEAINVVSDCRSGYNLSIATSGSSNLYAGGDSINPATFTAVDGTSAISSSNNTNKWGYTMNANPTSSTVFSPLSTTVATLKTSSQTASPSSDIDDTFNINYGVKVDTSVAPGSYGLASNGSIIYYLTMDVTCTRYTVAFNANGGSGTMTSQNIQEGDTANLTAKAFTAPSGASYTDANNNTINGDADKLWAFWGWNTEVDGTGDWYKDKESITDLGNSGDTVTLYAQWKQATLSDMTAGTPLGTEKVIDHNLMQDMLPETCYNSDITTAANAPAATLLDYRGKVTTGDNPEQPEQYTVSKLADGLCWMTTNLNLGRSTGGPNGNGTITLTPDDTDITSNFTLPAGDTTSYTSTTNLAKIRLTNNSGTNANGVYYTWAAAVANTTSISTNPTTSVCPKGWDLPTNAQFTNLSSKSSYSSSKPPTAAPSSFLQGKFTNGATFYPSSYNYGFYWSSTSSSTTAAYGARTTASALSTSASTGTTYGGNKYYRKNLRCVASQGTVTVNYDGNGTNEYPVTGATASQENIEISAGVTAQANGFSRDGWVFNNWNTAPDGSGTTISAGALIDTTLKPNETITLYAQWLPAYTITYVNNCQTYTNASCTQEVSDSTGTQEIILDTSGNGSGTLGASNYNSWALTGWKIKGWSTVADNSSGTYTEYPASSTYAVTGQSVGSGITLYAHWAPTYYIQYDGNGASNANGMGTTNANGVKSLKQTNIGEGDPVTLFPSNFKRSNYSFAGWSTDSNAWAHFTDNDSTNDPIIYGPMETIEAPAYSSSTNGILTFYAVWIPAETSGGNPVYLQDFGSTECASLTSATFNSTTGEITPGSVIALTDKRDNQVYTIAKLADDKCWMVENLRLDNQYTVGQNQNDSSVTNESLSQGYGGTPGTYGSFVGLANPENSGSLSGNTTANSVYKSDGSGSVFDSSLGTLEDIGTSDNPVYRLPRYNNKNTSNTINNPSGDLSGNYPLSVGGYSWSKSYLGGNVYSYGNYYNWAAAMANTDDMASSSVSEFAGTSICPAGWTLPTSGSTTKDFGILSQAYGGTGNEQSSDSDGANVMNNRFRTFPNNFILSLTPSSGGPESGYVSRSLYSTSYRYILYIGGGQVVRPSFSYTKTNGESVRCMINPSNIEVVLDYNNGTGNAFRLYGAAGSSVTLNKPYKILPDMAFSGWNTSSDGSGTGYTTSYTIPTGSSSVTLYAQWKQPVYSIQYDGNGASNANGMGTTNANGVKSLKQTNIGEGDPVTLFPSNFKRSNYSFAGWSTDSNAWAHFTDNDSTNDPIIYGPMETIEAPAYSSSTNGILTFYAVWIPAETSGGNPVYLQDFGSTECASLTSATFNSTTGEITPGSVIALTDKRDNQVYTIAKLADDKCWMVENLRLDNQYTVGQNQNDSSVTNESLSQGYGKYSGTGTNYGDFVGLADTETTNFTTTTANSLYSTTTSGNKVVINTADSPAYRFPRYNNGNTYNLVDSPTYTQDYSITSSPTSSGTNYVTSSNVYSYGNYYTWPAAMANTNYMASSSVSEIAGTSICPTGWVLPTARGNNKDFDLLAQRYGYTGSPETDVFSGGDIMSSRLRTFPNNFLYSGYFYTTASSRGNTGYYLTRSLDSNTTSYALSIRYAYFYPSTAVLNNNRTGQNVRCLVAGS